MRGRSAFGYLEPHPDIPDHAQCATCRIWLEDADRCLWLQANDEVLRNDSCILYVQGPPMRGREPLGVLTKEEVGFYRGSVRCENCVSINGDACELYRKLNRDMPKIFSLDARIKPRACCNAFDDVGSR